MDWPFSLAKGIANQQKDLRSVRKRFNLVARKQLAGGDTSAGRLGTSRKMFQPLFLYLQLCKAVRSGPVLVGKGLRAWAPGVLGQGRVD